MGIVTSTSVSNAQLTQSNTTPVIYNVTLTLGNTEYSQALPANCKRFVLRLRQLANLRLAYASGDTATTYITLPAGAVFTDSSFYASQTLYFQSPTAGVILELAAYA